MVVNFGGKGYATEALSAVLDYLLNEVEFDLIEALNLVTNKASGRVMEKAGMMYEATLRKRMYDKITKEKVDVKVYSKERGE